MRTLLLMRKMVLSICLALDPAGSGAIRAGTFRCARAPLAGGHKVPKLAQPCGFAENRTFSSPRTPCANAAEICGF
jgi:hypothetical protein